MRSQLAWLSACSCALIVAGCGGNEAQTDPAPTLPSALAERLASGAETVAARLDDGDPCGAAASANTLTQQAIAAVNTPDVPAELKEQLLGSMQELADRVAGECAAAAQPPPPPGTTVEEDDEDDEGRRKNGKGKKGKGKGRGKKNGREEDD